MRAVFEKEGLSRKLLAEGEELFVYDFCTLYAASHDGRLFWVDMEAFGVQSMAKGAHKKMFHCAGVYGDRLVTVSYPCSEISLWNKETLEKIQTLEVPLRLSGNGVVEENILYLSSRNIMGIGLVRLDAE